MHRYRGRKLGEMEPDGYVEDVEPGDEIRWGDWDHPGNVDGQAFTLIPYCHGSDYSGNLVERSNYNYIVENHGDEVVLIEGGYGTFGVGFLGNASDLSEDLQDVIAGLHDYPLVDDSGHSELEWDTAMASWDSHGNEDFRRALDKAFPDEESIIERAYDGGKLGTLYWNLCDKYHGGESYRNDQGDEISFFVHEVIDDITDEDWTAWLADEMGYMDPNTDEGRVLADAIFEWFAPFAELKAAA